MDAHLSSNLRVFVDWVAELVARSDLVHCKCSLPKAQAEGALCVPPPKAAKPPAPIDSAVA